MKTLSRMYTSPFDRTRNKSIIRFVKILNRDNRNLFEYTQVSGVSGILWRNIKININKE